MLGDGVGVAAAARDRQGARVDVGGEDLYVRRHVHPGDLFSQQDGEGVGLFPRSAAEHPQPDPIVR